MDGRSATKRSWPGGGRKRPEAPVAYQWMGPLAGLHSPWGQQPNCEEGWPEMPVPRFYTHKARGLTSAAGEHQGEQLVVWFHLP